MKNLFCAIFILMTLNANAQFADLMNDKNIAWVAESSMDIRLDVLDDESKTDIAEKTQYNFNDLLRILKFQNNGSEDDDESMFFSHFLFTSVAREQLKIYTDSSCLHETNFSTAVNVTRDTFAMIDPTTYESKYVIESCPGFIREVILFRVYQITNYNTKTNKWSNRVLSIAPLKKVNTKEGKFLFWHPLFWIKVDNEKANIQSASITWVARTSGRAEKSLIDVSLIKVLKKTSSNMPIPHFLNIVKNNKKVRFYKGRSGWGNTEILSFDERQKIFDSSDSIQTVDSKTYEIRTKIIRNNLDIKEVCKMRFVQEWAWDDKRKKLLVNLLGVAPLRNVYNDYGEFLYYEALFYQRFDD
jgi:hypothetical protein